MFNIQFELRIIPIVLSMHVCVNPGRFLDIIHRDFWEGLAAVVLLGILRERR